MPIAYKDDFIRSHIKNAHSTTLIRGKYSHFKVMSTYGHMI
jgi:hypothetical protein